SRRIRLRRSLRASERIPVMQRPADDVTKILLGMAPEVAGEARIKGHRHEFGLDDIVRCEVAGRYDGSPQSADALAGRVRTVQAAAEMRGGPRKSIDRSDGGERHGLPPSIASSTAAMAPFGARARRMSAALAPNCRAKLSRIAESRSIVSIAVPPLCVSM